MFINLLFWVNKDFEKCLNKRPLKIKEYFGN